MKAAGNMGVKEIIPYVQPYVEGHVQFDIFNRENALWGLRHVGYKAPDKVINFLQSLSDNLAKEQNWNVVFSVFCITCSKKSNSFKIIQKA